MKQSGRTQGHMPVEAYTSDEWFQREQRDLFGQVWQFGGFVEDLPDPGDCMTVQAGCHPLFVVRGDDGELRAFHNICRHRGTQLLRSIGKSKQSIICPYHHWTYSLDGDLKHVPGQKEQFPELDRATMCLHKASVATWLGMFFVHADPAAAPLEDWFAGVGEMIGPHRPEELVEYEDASTRHEIQANWKIVVENYMDGYHLAHLHSHTLSMYDHSRQESGYIGPHFVFYEPLTKKYRETVEQQAPMPLIDHGPHDQMGAWVPMLFPNLGIGASESTWSIFHVIPVSAEKTIVVTRTKVMPVSSWEFTKQAIKCWWNWKGRSGGKFDDGPDDPLSSGDFMAEDVFACEQQQKAMHSPKFAVGAMALTLEKSILDYQQHVLKYVPVEE